MNEFYWLTRLDVVNTILLISLIIGCFFILISIFIILDKRSEYRFEEDNDDYILTKKVLRTSSIVTFIICLLYIFIPTQKQALII